MNNGILDVSGGGGGFGGLYPGGGGGGGRIAIYGQSILMSTSQGSESVVSCGGPCGVQTSLVNISTPSLVIDVTLFSVLPLDSQSLSFIAESYLSGRLAGEDYISLNASAVFLNQTFGNTTEYIVNQILTLSSSANLTTVLSQLAEMEVYTMADVTVVGLSLLSVQVVNITTTQTINTVCSNPGSNGTIFLSSQLEQVVFIDSSDGAEGTSKALHIIASDHSPFGNDALSIPFTPSQPSRISYYCKTKSVATATTKADFGSLVTLTSNGAINVVGIYFGESITHGSNFEFIPSDSFRATSLNTLEDYPVLDEWYKFDIHMNWQMGTYYLLLNDVMVAKDQPFQAEFLDALQISTFHATDILLDEIYIGVDPTMSFQCPLSQSVGLKVQGAAQFNWKESQVYGGGNGIEAFNKMTRHYSFYEPSNVVPFDGQGSISFQQDYQFPFSQTSLPQLHSAALLYLTSTGRSQQVIGDSSATTASKLGWWKKTNVMDPAGDGRYFWYIEMDYNSSLSSTQNGGICACSSQDLKRWRFEGIIFQYTNLTDMVFGSPGPFHMEKPKVLQNNVTGNFVLWAVMDNMNRSLGAAVVLTSPYEDGPFYFRRSLYPDGNMTHDQSTHPFSFSLQYLII